MRPSAELRPQIKPDKFFSPKVDTPQFLYRERVVTSLLRLIDSRPATIIVEAQAGLGKTTTIKQYLDQAAIASAWYQVGREDGDPNYFLQAISACISSLRPDCPSVDIRRLLGEGDGSRFDLQRRLDLLVRELRLCLKHDLYLVFDDLHYLLPYPTSLFILNTLLESAPPRLHFILSSREPLPFSDWQAISSQRNVLRLDSRTLAMDEHEVTDFFHQVLHLAVPLNTIKEITRVTDGWVMGIRLLGLQMEQRQGKPSLPAQFDNEETDHQEILDYFRREVFTLIEEPLHRPLLTVSLLDTIPVALAIELTGKSELGDALKELARRNIFIRQLDTHHSEFGLHYLFRQFLREKARQELSPAAIQGIFHQAGQFHLNKGDPAKALHYLVRSADYDLVEAVLKNNGMQFLATNQASLLAAILDRIPESCRNRQGWSSFFLALARMDSMPMQALPLLDQALAIFMARHDEIGELLCLTHIISIHITTTGHYRDGEDLLHRAVPLFSRTADTLDVSTTILIARSLAMGYCIFLADTDEATRYAILGLTLARKEHLVNFEAALLMVMGYIRIFAGHTSLARLHLEQAAPFVNRPEVGTFNRLGIRMMLFNFLFHDGEFTNYFDQKNQLIDAFGLELVSQSIAGPFCCIWEMDMAINQGCFQKALDLAEQALARHPPLSPHLASQILHLKAVALTMTSNYDQALAASQESIQLRQMAGGRYFTTLNRLLAGLVSAGCGHHGQGMALLDQGIEDARQMPTEYLEACGLLHRAAILLDANEPRSARPDVETGLRLMRRNAYRHFWAWTPAAMEQVLTFAVTHGIEPAYARTLAADRLDLELLDDGTALPLLDIQTLGGFTIRHRAQTLLDAEDLTPLQRELLALLLAAPDCKVPQDTIHLHFWPDSPQDTVKIKFDTLVSRLRKTLNEVLPTNTAHLYLNREKGMLWLAYCRVDAHQFIDGAKRGMIHYRLQEFWQAGNVFTVTEPLWCGEFAPGIAGEERIRSFRDALSHALSEMALAWSDLLAESERLPLAIQVLEKALQHDNLNDQLYAQLYRLEGRRSALHSRRVLKRLEATLRQEGYADDEIAEFFVTIKTAEDSTGSLYRR